MSLDELSPEQIEVKQQEFLKSVPVATSIGNKALRERPFRGLGRQCKLGHL